MSPSPLIFADVQIREGLPPSWNIRYIEVVLMRNEDYNSYNDPIGRWVVNNIAIAEVFRNIADLLELKEENSFKIRAYRRAARAIEDLPVELEQLMKEGRLREVPGIGEAIAKKVESLLTTGSLELYDKLRAEFPEGIIALMNIPGIGPKTAMRLVKELGISNIEELEKAILEGKVAGLFRLGEKTAENILHHIQTMRRGEHKAFLSRNKSKGGS